EVAGIGDQAHVYHRRTEDEAERARRRTGCRGRQVELEGLYGQLACPDEVGCPGPEEVGYGPLDGGAVAAGRAQQGPEEPHVGIGEDPRARDGRGDATSCLDDETEVVGCDVAVA